MSGFSNRHPSENDPDSLLRKAIAVLVVFGVLVALFVLCGVPWLQSKGLA